MKIELFVNNPFRENTIVLYDETGEAAIVDCGCYTPEEETAVAAFFREQGLTPVALLNTHLHIDHILGNRFAEERFGLLSRAAKEDEYLLACVPEHALRFGMKGVNEPPVLGGYLKDGDTVAFGHTELRVIATPGHTPGGLCFYHEAGRLLLSGDTLFAGSIGRTDLPGGDTGQLLDAIRTKLFVLDEKTQVIPGHGQATTIGREKSSNPFVRP
ncbi:MAG: MBL fold metallo-hydrolase [Culturomica sp.]|jgi:glyoxylase-like metal-dependent hydrolase (beta-lactamase superfamily II)|nr:MBL fold metallo-hydrolase [Culturomica sp.]